MLPSGDLMLLITLLNNLEEVQAIFTSLSNRNERIAKAFEVV
jgi:hypothetical protein